MLAYLVVLTMASAAATRAEIIDRIAVTLDNEAITASEIDREIRLTAFLNGDALDFSPEARRKAAERLIEQRLIRREIELGRYAEPAPSELEPLLKQLQAQRFQAAQQYRDALAQYSITEAELKAHLLWQATLLRFLDLRFGAGVQVSEEEIRQYFDRQAPAPQGNADSSRKLDEQRDAIRQKLTEAQIDKQMDEWLKETRKRARIEFRPDAFR